MVDCNQFKACKGKGLVFLNFLMQILTMDMILANTDYALEVFE